MKKYFSLFASLLIFIILSCGNEGMVQLGIDSQEDPRLPEINIKESSTSTDIASGTGIYTISESQVADTQAEITFNIENLGNTELKLTGDPLVSISGQDASDFSVSEFPAEEAIGPGRYTTFKLLFNPATVAEKTAMLTVMNNDPDEENYTFTITGSTHAEISVKQGDNTISKGMNGFVFSNIQINNSSSQVQFTIKNLGIGDLVLSANPAVSITGTPADIGMFTVTQPAATIIPPGGDASFSVVYNPKSLIHATITININSNDSVNNPYTFTVIGYVKSRTDFTARIRKGIAPLDVQFNDASTGEITSYSWDFGDGTTSTLQNPLHTFESGNYTVQLTTTGPGGEAYKYKTNFVSSTPPIRHEIASNYYGVGAIYPGDFNGDSKQDIVSILGNGEGLSVFLNYGNGIFGTDHLVYEDTVTFPGINSVMTADIDSDGDKDIIASFNNSDNAIADISWFQNDGTGINWTKKDVVLNFSICRSIYVADIDGDINKRPDILGASSANNEVAYWINSGSGTYFPTKTTVINTTAFMNPMIVFAANLYGNGMDIIAGNHNDGIRYWLKSETYSNTTPHILPDSAGNPAGIYCADINNDGRMDILAAQADANEIVCWLNLTTGFEKHVLMSNVNSASSVYSIDMDLDGDNDVIYTSAYDDDLVWLENKGNMNFTKHLILGSYNGAASVFSIDVNGDGKRDIISSAFGTQTIDWWEIYSQWNKTKVNADAAYFSMAKGADIDKDGDTDIVASEKDSDTLSWWQNDGSGNFMRKYVIDADFKQANSITPLDVDKDGDIDILASANEGGLAWWENSDVSFPGTGNGTTWIKHIVDANFTGTCHVISADINLDNNPDIVGYRSYSRPAPDRYTGEIVFWLNDGFGNFGAKQTVFSESTGSMLTFIDDLTVDCLDIDGNLYPDIVMGLPKHTSTLVYSGRLSWFKNIGGTFGSEQSIDITTPSINSLKIYDINKDGVKDIVGCWYARTTPNEVCWWENTGDGNGDGSNDVVISNATKQIINNDFKNPIALTIADLDGDGKDDIIAGCRNTDTIAYSCIVWHKGNGNGTFTGKYPINNSNFPGLNYLTTFDVDGDNDLEVVGASGMDNGANELAIWENNLVTWGQ